jgi:D-glycero-D-manno-heptose 1,7-bisphosphate phosphatase
MKTVKFPTVFIDRDGTINKEAGYMNHEDSFEIYPFVYHALKLLNIYNVLAVVVTNQAGIARGYFPEDIMHRLHKKMYKEFYKRGVKINGLYYCPHHPSSKIPELAIDCNCRKPKTGMFEQALRELPIDTNKLYMIGDKFSDIKFGHNIGAKTVMVKTGYGKGEIELNYSSQKILPDIIKENLLQAVLWIIKDLGV